MKRIEFGINLLKMKNFGFFPVKCSLLDRGGVRKMHWEVNSEFIEAMD